MFGRRLLLPAGLGLLLPRALRAQFVGSAPGYGGYSVSSAGGAVTGTLSETAIGNLRIPANTMGAKGVALISALFTYTNSSNSKTMNVKFNATSGTAGQILGTALSVTTTAETQMLFFLRNTATNAQLSFAANGVSQLASNAGTPFAPAVDTTADSFINITGTLANTGETITCAHAFVAVFPSA